MTSTIAVVLPTLNRVAMLADALQSLRRQTVQPANLQILVVDNGSTDGTEAMVLRAARSLPGLTYVREPTPGLHAARNRALAETDAAILLYGDDDMTASPSWVEAMGRAFEDDRVGVCGGPCPPAFEQPRPAWVDDLWVAVPEGRIIPEWSVAELHLGAGEVDPDLVWGCNYGVRRSCLEAVGGFHPDGFPQELLAWRGDGENHVSRAAARAGWHIRYEPAASVSHRVSVARMTSDYLSRRGFRNGVSASYTDYRASAARAPQGDEPRWPNMAMFRRRVKRAARGLVVPASPRDLVSRGFDRGYRWHRRQLRRDPALMDWILQPHYLGDAGIVPPHRSSPGSA